MIADRSADSWASLYKDHAAAWERRFADACGACGIDGAVVFSGAVKYRHRDDLEYPFFAEPYFKAWVPHAYPGSAVRIVPGETPLLVYLRDEDFWHMPAPEPEGLLDREFRNPPRLVRGDPAGGTGRGVAPGRHRRGSPRRDGVRERQRPDAAVAPGTIRAPSRHPTRWLAWRRRAASAPLATRPRSARWPTRRPEFELNEIYCRASGQRESALPYQNIVALNEHAGILHYQHLDRQPPARFRTFLLDAGGDCNGYASDITRTWTSPGGPVRRPDRLNGCHAATTMRGGAPGHGLCRPERPGAPVAGRGARGARDRPLLRRRVLRAGHHAGLPAARARPPAGPAGARRRRPPGGARRSRTPSPPPSIRSCA